MEFDIEVLSPEVWATVSEGTHYEVFRNFKPKDWDRISFALLALKKGEKLPIAYMTCREMSKSCVYWQFGGSFQEIRGSFTSWAVYKAFLEWTKKRYKQVYTYTANTNAAYLKMALKAGFLIVGTRNVRGEVFVDLTLEFEENKGCSEQSQDTQS